MQQPMDQNYGYGNSNQEVSAGQEMPLEQPQETSVEQPQNILINTNKGQVSLSELINLSNDDLTNLGVSDEDIKMIENYKLQSSQSVGEDYKKEFLERVKDKNLNEETEKIRDSILLEDKNSEFVFGNQHYLTNDYVSPDRNNTGYISFNEPDRRQILENTHSKYESKKVLKGIEKLQDSVLDRRFLTKKERKKDVL